MILLLEQMFVSKHDTQNGTFVAGSVARNPSSLKWENGTCPYFPSRPFSKLSLDYKLAYANLLLEINSVVDQKQQLRSAKKARGNL